MLILESDQSLLRYKKQKNEDSNIEVTDFDLRSNQTKKPKKKKKKEAKGILAWHISGMRNITVNHVQLGMAGKMTECTLLLAMSMITNLHCRDMTEEIFRRWVKVEISVQV